MSLKILLADDSLTAQNMGKKILAEAGYEVVAVSNGAQAMKKIAADTPDLVVLDVYMPGYSGVEVCERIRSSRETASIPVVLSVGKMEAFKPEEGTRVRADGLIVKPFEATELLAVVKKLVNRAASAATRQAPRTASPEAAPADDGSAADTAAPPEFEIQHQSVDVPKEVASAPVIGMDLISEEAQPLEFEIERPLEPAQVEAGLRLAAAGGLSGVFELGPSDASASGSSVPEIVPPEAQQPPASKDISGGNDPASSEFELMNGPSAYEHGAASEDVEETAPRVMEPTAAGERELLAHSNNPASFETEAPAAPPASPELTSWNNSVARPVLEVPDLSAVPAMETSPAGVITPKWIAEEVEVAPEERAVSLRQQMPPKNASAEAPALYEFETPEQAHHPLPTDGSLAVECSTASELNNPVTVEPPPAASEPVIREAALDSGRITSIVEHLLERLKPEVIAAVTRELEKKS